MAAKLVGSAGCFGLTMLYFAMAWTVVFTMRLGPVIGVVDASAGRGVHAGDLLAIPLVLMGMVMYAQGVAGVHGSGHRRGVGHRGNAPAMAAVIHIRPASSSLPVMQPAAA